MTQNYSRLLKFLLRQCFDQHLAEDALHEALIVTMHKWEIVSKHERPLYWVRRTAWHKLLTLDDKQKWKDTVPLESIPEEPAEPTGSQEAEMVLRFLLRQLPLQQRAVLALMVEGDTDDQIALQLGLAITTVRTYKCEVRKKYRSLYRSGDEGSPA
ncbi:RNA polymerase sigma factor [Actinoplanes sp. NPDC049599]|uniref:RNA polymerase sigma factor n=1 Tax=Actinoplanes sp. NPDC049599 TaxID=3363903 RepID=UPI0037A1B623